VEDVNRKTQKKRGKVLIFLTFLTVYLFQSIIWLLYFSSNSGRNTDICPALVLTGEKDMFTYSKIGKTDYILPVSSGDMLFNVFNEYLGFLA
jgi:hypothetical protein